MSLLEQDAERLAAALDDYELMSVSDIGGTDESGYWLTVRDQRFGLDYEIASHSDYWDYLGYFCSGLMWPVKPLRPRRWRDGTPDPRARARQETAMSIRPDGATHKVVVCSPPGQHEGNEDRYELECDVCHHIGAADTFADAEAMARLHEAFVAVLVDAWKVDR